MKDNPEIYPAVYRLYWFSRPTEQVNSEEEFCPGGGGGGRGLPYETDGDPRRLA